MLAKTCYKTCKDVHNYQNSNSNNNKIKSNKFRCTWNWKKVFQLPLGARLSTKAKHCYKTLAYSRFETTATLGE